MNENIHWLTIKAVEWNVVFDVCLVAAQYKTFLLWAVLKWNNGLCLLNSQKLEKFRSYLDDPSELVCSVNVILPLTYVTCYHKMNVKSPVCIQRYSFLNMSLNNGKQRKINTKLIFAGQNKKLYPHIIYHFKGCVMKNLNL